VSVTKNLELALRQLFSVDQGKVLWVDALCIDQTNASEWSVQVSKMNFVYQQAQGVISWLRREYNHSADAFKLLESFRDTGVLKSVYEGPEPVPSDFVPNASAVHKVSAVIELFNREYWKRCWIVQEIALAKQVMFHCGSDWISWKDMKRVCAAMIRDLPFITQALYSTEIEHLLWQLGSYGPNMLDRIGDDTTKDLSKTTLAYVLLSHRWKKATDTRDKVYSLLGLLSFETRNRVAIDYGLEPHILFRNIATLIATEEKTLRILAENKPLFVP
jgi:hypothetical protein